LKAVWTLVYNEKSAKLTPTSHLKGMKNEVG
jgi:hypothetical protein